MGKIKHVRWLVYSRGLSETVSRTLLVLINLVFFLFNFFDYFYRQKRKTRTLINVNDIILILYFCFDLPNIA